MVHIGVALPDGVDQRFNLQGNGGLSTTTLATSINALQTLTTEAEAANGTNALNVTTALGLTVPGLAISNVQLFLTQGQVPQVANGTAGTDGIHVAGDGRPPNEPLYRRRVTGTTRRATVDSERNGDAENAQLFDQVRQAPRWPGST